MNEHSDSVVQGWLGMSPASLAARLRSLASDLESLDRFGGVGVTGVVEANWGTTSYDACIRAWRDRPVQDPVGALKKEPAISFAAPDKEPDSDAMQIADILVDMPAWTRGHVEAAVRWFGIPVNESDVDMLISESRSRLHQCFQARHPPTTAMKPTSLTGVTSLTNWGH